MILINFSVIDEKYIIGISELIVERKDQVYKFERCCYNLYLQFYTVRIATDWFSSLNEVEDKKVIFEIFKNEYFALMKSIHDHNFDVYKAYCDDITDKAYMKFKSRLLNDAFNAKTKNPKG